MIERLNEIRDWNIVSVSIVIIVAASLIFGLRRGAVHSARHFMGFVGEGIITTAGLFISWKVAEWVSPYAAEWLNSLNIKIPNQKINVIMQGFYTFITGVRDFPLLRFGVLFLLGYIIIKQVLYLIWGAAAAQIKYSTCLMMI